ncbi:MAG: hypothetical protein FWG09_04985 [Synergistaceae bacterium]|nr:hypothetical protein [Synergistaceae bacterium]
MSRKLSKPSLKNYLSTGKVVIEEPQEVHEAPKAAAEKKTGEGKGVNADKLLGFFSEEDLATWEPVFKAGAEIKKEKLDLVGLRNFFRTMDRVRFTLYILESEKAAMRIIRSGVQIREPFLLFLLWDDIGVASIYSGENPVL